MPLDMLRSPSGRPGRRRSLTRSEWMLLAEAIGTLAYASLALAVMPFKRVVAATAAPGTARTPRPVDLKRLRWAIEASARRVPWRAVCFQRALCFRMMLRRRGVPSLLHYGIAADGPDRIKAHVWLSVAGETVIGGEVAPDFACVASFACGDQP